VYTEKLLMMDRGTVRNTKKFYSKNEFEKLVHLFGFIIRINVMHRTKALPTTFAVTEFGSGEC